IQRMAIFGPNIRDVGSSPSSTMVVVERLWTEIENQPSSNDLERLIDLITPSTDMYDKEDDLMIDVLLRQRRQGSVLRGGIDNIRKNVISRHFQRLVYVSDELSKLATFAKYIPQDERPGMLSLVDIKKFVVSLAVGRDVGDLELVAANAEVCHVGVPS